MTLGILPPTVHNHREEFAIFAPEQKRKCFFLFTIYNFIYLCR